MDISNHRARLDVPKMLARYDQTWWAKERNQGYARRPLTEESEENEWKV
jgi:hypothetical protein